MLTKTHVILALFVLNITALVIMTDMYGSTDFWVQKYNACNFDLRSHQNGDMNHDNELTIQDLSILAAQINNK